MTVSTDKNQLTGDLSTIPASILAIETSTSICSVSLLHDRKVTVQKVDARGVHSTAIFTQVQELLGGHRLQMNELDCIAVGRGPGSYTGLRIASSAVKGLLFGLSVPFYAVNTLAGFAVTARSYGRVHAIIDARRSHVYLQTFEVYKNNPMEGIKIDPCGHATTIQIDSLPTRFQAGDVLVGSGIPRIPEAYLEGVQTIPFEQVDSTGVLYLAARNYQMAMSSHIGETLPLELVNLANIQDFEPEYEVPEAD